MSEGNMVRANLIRNYLLGEYLVDDPGTAERKLHNYCKELLSAYLECEARRAELFADAMTARIDLRAAYRLADEYGEFCAGGDARHIQFVKWLDLREGNWHE